MSTPEYDFQTLRNTTTYAGTGLLTGGYVMTVSSNGKSVWTNQLTLSTLTVSSVNGNDGIGRTGPTLVDHRRVDRHRMGFFGVIDCR